MHVAVQVTLIIVGAWVLVALIVGIVLWQLHKAAIQDTHERRAEFDKRAAESRAEFYKRAEERRADLLKRFKR